MSNLKEILSSLQDRQRSAVELLRLPVVRFWHGALQDGYVSIGTGANEGIFCYDYYLGGKEEEHVTNTSLQVLLNYLSQDLYYGAGVSESGIAGLNIDPQGLSAWLDEASVIARFSEFCSHVERFYAIKSLDSFKTVSSEIERVSHICREIREYRTAMKRSPLVGDRSLMHQPLAVCAEVRDDLGNTLLHCCEDDPGLIEVLVRSGVPVNEQNEFGDTALHFHMRNPECTRLLLELGADPSISNRWGIHCIDLVSRELFAVGDIARDIVGRLGSDVASLGVSQAACVELNKMLCQAISDGDKEKCSDLFSLGFAIRFPFRDEYHPDESPFAASLDAADLESLKRIMAADTSTTKKFLSLAFGRAEYVKSEKERELLSYALSYCDEIVQIGDIADVFGSYVPDEEIAAYFRRLDIDVNSAFVMNGNELLLHFLVKSKLFDRIPLLISLGADPYLKNGDGFTAFDIASTLPGADSRRAISVLESSLLKRDKNTAHRSNCDSLGL